MSRKGKNRGAKKVESKDPIQQQQQGAETGAAENQTNLGAEGVNDGGALLDEIAADDVAALGGDEGANGEEGGADTTEGEGAAPAAPAEGGEQTGGEATAGEQGTANGETVVEPTPATNGEEVKDQGGEQPPVNTEVVQTLAVTTTTEPTPPVADTAANGVANGEQLAAAAAGTVETPVAPTVGTETTVNTNEGEQGNEGGVEADPFAELFKFQTFSAEEERAARDFVTRINRYIKKMDPNEYIDPKDAAFEQRALYNAYLVALTGSAKLARWAVPYLLDKFYEHRNGVFSANRINHCLSLVNLTKEKLTLLTGLNNLFLSTCEPEGRKQNLKRVNLRQLTTQIATVWGHSRYGINLLEGYNLAGI